MAIVAGTMLGPYEVTSPLGAGGMAEVYAARDTRLGRDVAIKVLPDSFAAHADRLRRFEQEARVVSALNHPNIVAIFDIGAQDGIHYLVSELLHGGTLRERIGDHPLPARKVREYALQLARGLAAAHDKGIVHRDLKPENIFITRDEQVKILDFGLAKDVRVMQAEATATVSKTAEGVVMGTVGYMSPEQVRGVAVDHRTDIFSFGAVLYEMISGHRAFQRQSSVETMNAILKEDPPDLETAQVSTSPGLERVMRRCLEKTPERRFQSASDLAFAIEALSEPTASTVAQKLAIKPARKLPFAFAAIALVAIAAAILAGAYFLRPPQPVFRQLVFGPGYVSSARFTPDGQNVVYGASWNGKPFELFQVSATNPGSRSLGLPSADILGMSSNGDLALSLNHHCFFQWINAGTLARAPLNGGAARPLVDNVCGADISSDGKNFAIVRCNGTEQTLEFPIGHVLFRTNGYVDRLRFSRDGKRIAVAEHPIAGDDRGFVSVVDTNNGKLTRLSREFPGIKGLSWGPAGNEIWISSATGDSDNDAIWAVTLNGKQRKLFAGPGDVWITDTNPGGRALVLNARSSSEMVIHRPGTAKDEPVFSEGGDNTIGGIAGNGTLAITNSSVGIDYQTEVVTAASRFPVALGDGNACGISPDGKWVLSVLPSAPTKSVLYPTGTGEARRFDLSPISNTGAFCSWTADGTQVVFTGSEPGKALRAYLLDLRTGTAKPVTPEDTTGAILSPDGKNIIAKQKDAYFVYPVAGGDGHPVKGLALDETPVGWHESSRKVFIWNGRFPATLMLVDLETGKRDRWAQLNPPENAGLVWGTILIAPNGQSYAYRYRRILTTLFAVDGLR